MGSVVEAQLRVFRIKNCVVPGRINFQARSAKDDRVFNPTEGTRVIAHVITKRISYIGGDGKQAFHGPFAAPDRDLEMFRMQQCRNGVQGDGHVLSVGQFRSNGSLFREYRKNSPKASTPFQGL
jgi:hypothetical protein